MSRRWIYYGLVIFALFNPVVSAATAPPRPHILLAIADDWSFGHAGVYGCKWVKTPHFDRIAREGILFQRAYTPNAKCSPSRAALLTGRNPWQLGAGANHFCYFPAEFSTYPEVLERHGYFVGMTAKGWSPGVALDAAGRSRDLAGKRFDLHALTPPTTGILPIDYAANFRSFLDAAPSEQPWCFWFGAGEPHRDYEEGSGVQYGGKKTEMIDRVPACWPDDEVIRNDMLDYAVEVEWFDAQLGKMIAELAARNLLDSTWIIVTSDNGMPFPRMKGNTYDGSNRLPLAMRWPAGIQNPGRVEDGYVSLIDLAPTIIEAASLTEKDHGMAAMTGRSLSDIFADVPDRKTRDQVILGRERNDVGRPNDLGYPTRGIVRENFLYLKNYAPDRWPAGNPETGYLDADAGSAKTHVLNSRKNGCDPRFWQACFGKRPAQELYNLTEDPDCMMNLAEDLKSAQTMAKMSTRLFEELKQQGDPRIIEGGEPFEKFPNAEGPMVDYHRRFLQGDAGLAPWARSTDYEPIIPSPYSSD
ncbi:MAG: heparan N-sulfatase [Verrucomicrobia bacterium]|nr:MAG: heparan N-sulfatase [Verrucomicrobiota bacterium]